MDKNRRLQHALRRRSSMLLQRLPTLFPPLAANTLVVPDDKRRRLQTPLRFSHLLAVRQAGIRVLQRGHEAASNPLCHVGADRIAQQTILRRIAQFGSNLLRVESVLIEGVTFADRPYWNFQIEPVVGESLKSATLKRCEAAHAETACNLLLLSSSAAVWRCQGVGNILLRFKIGGVLATAFLKQNHGWRRRRFASLTNACSWSASR